MQMNKFSDSKNMEIWKYEEGMGGHFILKSTDFVPPTPVQLQSSTQLKFPGVFRSLESLQKFLLGFIRDLEEPDGAEEDYKNWLSDFKSGQIEKDEKKTIADI